MKLHTLFLVIILGIGGYATYNFAVTQFNQPALAYKRFASALLEGDIAKGRVQTHGNEALLAFGAHDIRMDQLNGTPRFVWYSFLDQRPSADGNSMTLTVRQTVRVDPPGSDSFFGTEIRRDRHVVTLVKDKSTWKVQQFEDSASQLMASRRQAGR